MRSVQRGISTILILVIILIIGIAFASGAFIFNQNQKVASVNSFDECAKLYPVMESYPAQCNTPDGKHFVQQLSEEEKQKLTPPVQQLLPNVFNDSVLENGLKEHANKDKGYRFQYPASFLLEERVKGFNVLYSKDSNMEDIFFSIDDRGDMAVQDRIDWWRPQLENFEVTEINVNNLKGAIITGKIKSGFGSGMTIKSVYLDLNGKELIFECARKGCESLEFNKILESFSKL